MMPFKDFKTDSSSLNEVLQKSDLDEELEQDFNTIDARFCRLDAMRFTRGSIAISYCCNCR